VRWDTDLIRRWSGGDVDLSQPLPSDLILAAAEADPALLRGVAPYLGMRALPASLDAVEAQARRIYASGWRPPSPPGPDIDQLADLISTASAVSSLAADR